jgi:hypothetical protein
MGRRRFLGALSTLGVSGAALQHLSKEALADLTADPSAEVPRLERLVHANHEAVAAGEEPPEREAEYYTIPRDEWVHVEATQDAMRRLDRKLNRLTSSDLVSVSVGTTVSGQQSERAVFVTYAERDGETPAVGFDELRDALPATVTGTAGTGPNAETREGIRVIPEQGTAGQDHGEDGGEDSHTCDTYDHLYRDPGIPAGALIRDAVPRGRPRTTTTRASTATRPPATASTSTTRSTSRRAATTPSATWTSGRTSSTTTPGR